MKNHSLLMWILLGVGIVMGISWLMGTWQPVTAQGGGTTLLVSVASNGTKANQFSGVHARRSISADGRYIVFDSWANNLVGSDTNGGYDVFVHDIQTRETTRVSVASDGTQTNKDAGAASISDDGRYVLFMSEATNLVPNDTNETQDVFVHDRQTGETMRVSIASDGSQANDWSGQGVISADGRSVVFLSGATNLVEDQTGIFVHDRQTGETTLVSVASDGTPDNQWSDRPTISGNGRFVAFLSASTNLVPDDTNQVWDIFVHDRQTGQTERISVASDGTQGDFDSYDPSISANGRFVSFTSNATTLAPNDTNYNCPSDGDPNPNCPDVFVHDRQIRETTLASVTQEGEPGNSWSGVNHIPPALSADGRFVVFWSNADNLVPNDTNDAPDAFVHDRLTGQNELVSVTSEGEQVVSTNFSPSITISDDGRVVAFGSDSNELVPDDTDHHDVFARIRELPTAVGVSGPSVLTQRRPLAALLVLAGGTLIALALRGARRERRPAKGEGVR